MMAQARLKSVHLMLLAVLALAPTAVLAQQDKASQSQKQQDPNQPEATQAKTETPQPQTQADEEGKLKSVPGGKALGMSILGNQEAPKALVIVPWKRSELGNALGISTMLDDSRLPVDKDVFMRMLSYYEIRSETTRPSGALTKSGEAQARQRAAVTNAAQPSTAAHRRKP